MYRIYFDPEDHAMDGLGWNVIDQGAVACRFSTSAQAFAWAKSFYDPPVPTNPTNED